MSAIDEILGHAHALASTNLLETSRIPNRHLAIVTCIDSRIELSALLGLDTGDANVLRNAGGRVTEDVLRSLAIAVHVLDVQDVVIIQHTGCGLEFVSNATLQEATGAKLSFLPIDDHATTLRDDVTLIATTSFLDRLENISGCLFDLATGRVDEVSRVTRTPR